MRYVNEVKVGLITLLAVVLLAAFAVYVRGLRSARQTYSLKVTFADARGLQPGDPVRMVGVKIGKVRSVEITPTRQALATLGIQRAVTLYDNYTFRVTSSGLIQERFVDVVPESYSPEAKRLEDGDRVKGVTSPDLSDLMASGVEVLDSLNRTSRILRGVLSDQEMLQSLKDSLTAFSESATAAKQLAESLSGLADESRPELVATLRNVRLASADLQATSETVRRHLQDTTIFDDLEETTRQASQAAAKANELLTSLADIADPETRAQIKETISAIHDTAESLKVFTGELRKAAPVVPKVAAEAENLAEYSSTIRERLKPPEINARFDVLYSGEADRSYSSGLLDIKTGKEKFLRLGIDDIGEDSTANIQLGDKQRRGVLRYGLVRSRLGFGLDYPFLRGGTISLDVLDPNDLRADLLADIPFVLGKKDVGLTLGVRDLGDDSFFVAGVRMRR